MNIRVVRTPEVITDFQGAQGRRLLITASANGHSQEAASVCLPAIERGPGSGFVWLKPGDYRCRMDRTQLASGRTFEVIRILQVPVYRRGGREMIDSVLIHAANWPHQLSGCLAPGLRAQAMGVQHSRRGMDALFAVLGGFELNHPVDLQCVDNYGPDGAA